MAVGLAPDTSARGQVLADLAAAFAEAVTDEQKLLQLVVERVSALTGDVCLIRLLERVRAVSDATLPDPTVGVWHSLIAERRVVRLAVAPGSLPPGLTPEQVGLIDKRTVSYLLGVPLIARGRVIGGVLAVRCGRADPHPDAEVAFLRDIAERAAVAIDNARLYTAARADLACAKDVEDALRAELSERLRVEAQCRESDERLHLIREAQAVQDTNALLEARTRDLAAANEELEAFSYSVSHDLRAPLRAIDGFSQALLTDYGGMLDETATSHLRRVRAGVGRMRQLIDDMLQLSRNTRVSLEPGRVELSRIAAEVERGLRAQDPLRVATVEIAGGLCVRGDPRLLRIVMENLLGNAWKFTRNRDDARIAVCATSGPDEVIVTVSDNGAGFDMAYARRLFQPFQRLHSAEEFEGTGIGLAIVRRIVHRHGGRVWAEGQTGGGASFHFSLPVRDQSEQAGATPTVSGSLRGGLVF